VKDKEPCPLCNSKHKNFRSAIKCVRIARFRAGEDIGCRNPNRAPTRRDFELLNKMEDYYKRNFR